MPEPESMAEGTQRLVDTIERVLGTLPGRTAVGAYRLPAPSVHTPRRLPMAREAADDENASGDSRGAHLEIRASDVFAAASLAKLPIAVEVLRRVSLGQFALDERFDTSSEPRVGGGGLLDFLAPATELTLRELSLLMIAVSDNTASNFLLDLVGMGEVNETISRMGLAQTRLARHFMDMQARAAKRENLTSANDMATLLAQVQRGMVAHARELRDMLRAQRCGDDIRDALPPDVDLEHKTGGLEGLFHDAGIVTGTRGACAYCVLTAEQDDLPAARLATGRIVRILWDSWCA